MTASKIEKQKIRENFCSNFSTGHILAALCMQYLHAWGFPFSKYFKIWYIFAQTFKYFALFCLFLAFFWNIACVPLLSRIGPERVLKFYNTITAKYYLTRLYLFVNNTLHLFINNSLNKNAVSCEFGHIYGKNPLMENFIFCIVI